MTDLLRIASVAALLLVSPPAPTLTPAERTLVDGIDREVIRSTTERLSARDMEGRAIGLPSGERAARYIASRFAAAGLRPAHGDAFLQPLTIQRREIDARATWLRVGSAQFTWGTDFVVRVRGGPDSLSIRGTIEVIGDSENERRAPSLQGRIVVVRATPGPGGTGDSAIETAVEQGAAAVVVASPRLDSMQFAALANQTSSPEIAPAGTAHRTTRSVPILAASARAAEQLLKSKGLDAVLEIRAPWRDYTAFNVVGMLPGSDSALAGEAVVFMAHYDAFGVRRDGAINAGAADNALGVGMLAAAAASMANREVRHRRTMIFLATTGEEHGGLGASAWAAEPQIAIDHLVAAINFDGIGMETFGEVRRVTGFGAEYSTLGSTLDTALVAMHLVREPDPFPSDHIFLHSDHIVLARRGVPSLMLLGMPAAPAEQSVARARAWVKTAYHAPGDTITTGWSWDGPRTMAATAALIGLRVANETARPRLLPGAPF